MDILRPQLLWVGKRCYRINNNIDINEQQQQQRSTNEYIENGECVCAIAMEIEKDKLEKKNFHECFISQDLYDENDDGEDCANAQDEYDVVEIAPNRYKTAFHVPQ